VAVHARACPRSPPRNLNGKEGVDGSSPQEGFPEIPGFTFARLAVGPAETLPPSSKAWRARAGEATGA